MRVLLDVNPTYQRLVALATGVFLVTGCGDKTLDRPLPAARQKLVVKGPWKNGATIPEKYTCDGDGTKPQVGARVPGNARDVALVMVDPDAPGGTFVHWTRWGRSSEGKNSFGTVGYGGPCPPKGDKPHHYVITVYALRGPLGLPSGSDAGKVVAAIRKKAYASGSLTGVYGR